MNIVYSSSDEYSEIAGVSLISLLENNKNISVIKVFIIDNEISDINKTRLKEIAESYKREIIFLNSIDIEELAKTKINVGTWHISTFLRLFLASILPSDIKKVIYIDCDTIILKSLDDLWNIDMNNKWVLGADDCRGKNYRKNIDLDYNSIYINNGFLLIDLEAWRSNNVEDLFLNFIKKYNGDITYVDQGVLNGALGNLNKVGLLDIKYNVQTVFYDLNYMEIKKYRNPVLKYSENDIENAIENPIVVHFTKCFVSGTRPWHNINNHKYRNEFLKYRSMTPWKDSNLWKARRSLSNKIFNAIYPIIPKSILFSLLSIVHSKIYPEIRNFKMKSIYIKNSINKKMEVKFNEDINSKNLS